MTKRTTNHERRATKRGFTLLEILITVIVLSIGVVSLMWAFSAGMFATTDVENVDLALNIAQANMEEVFNAVKGLDFGTLNEATYEKTSEADPDFSDFSVTIDLDDNTNPMQIDVTVAWTTKGGQASVVLSTLAVDF